MDTGELEIKEEHTDTGGVALFLNDSKHFQIEIQEENEDGTLSERESITAVYYVDKFDSNEEFDNVDSLKAKPTSSRGTPYHCTYCSFTTTIKTSLKTHINSHGITYTCSVCNRVYKYKEALRKHVIIAHSESEKSRSIDVNEYIDFIGGSQQNDQNPDEITHKCEKCSFKTKTNEKYKIHLQFCKAEQNKVYNCSECDYGTKKRALYQRHILSHTKGDLDLTSDEETKEADQSIHMNEEQYKCAICECYVLKKNMFDHSLTHQKSEIKKPRVEREIHKCNVCNYKTDSKHYMFVHQKSHFSKEYKCKFCNFETCIKSVLKKHLLTKHSIHHTQEERIVVQKNILYECDICKFSTKYLSDLKSHLFLEHSLKV